VTITTSVFARISIVTYKDHVAAKPGALPALSASRFAQLSRRSRWRAIMNPNRPGLYILGFGSFDTASLQLEPSFSLLL
jgi:hypothetical protein